MTEEQAKSLMGLGGKLVAALPAQFIALLLINMLVVGGMLFVEDRRSEGREHVLLKLLETCQHDGGAGDRG